MNSIRPATAHGILCFAACHFFPSFVGVKNFSIWTCIENSNRRRRAHRAEKLLTFPQSSLYFCSFADILIQRQHILLSAFQRQGYGMYFYIHEIPVFLLALCSFVDGFLFHSLQPPIHFVPAQTARVEQMVNSPPDGLIACITEQFFEGGIYKFESSVGPAHGDRQRVVG